MNTSILRKKGVCIYFSCVTEEYNTIFSGYMKENEGTVACQVGENKPDGRHSYSFVVLHV